MTTTTTRTAPQLPGRARADELAVTVLLGALVMVVWPVLDAMRGPGPFQPVVLIAHLAGMLAGFGVVVLVGLMARVPSLERGIGADRLARWHGLGGRLVVTLVVIHAYAATAAWAQSRQESGWLALWHVLRLPWLIAATLGTAMFLAVAVLSVRAARRRVSYEAWHATHLLVYLGVALSFVHQLAGPDLTGHRALQVAWALMYTLVFAAVLIHRVLTPLRTAGRHRLRVLEVYEEGPGVTTIVVEGRHLRELQAESGQFFRWRFLSPDTWLTAHPFSLSAPPTDDRLRLTVKTLGDGSAKLQKVEPGTWLLAEGPYGAMTAARRTRRNVLLIAGGVGITPMRALFETMPLSTGQDLLLVYRARSESDLLFRAELEHLAGSRGARVLFEFGDAAPPLDRRHLTRVCPDVCERDVYFCGPPGMSGALRKALRASGLPQEQFHEERFAF
ncbi:MAG: ferric reductase [Frankiales bacterium]|nr:ferric reductase [Frankiales bacterium]